MKHTAKPLGIFPPSISAEMLAIAACTHVHRTERASMVNSHSCDCDPGFQERSTERRCVEILTIVVVLVAGDTQLAWPEAALPRYAAGHGRSVLAAACLAVSRYLATAGLLDGTQLHGTPARRDIPRRPSNQTFVAVPKLKRNTSRRPPSALFFRNAEPQRRAAKHLGHTWYIGKRSPQIHMRHPQNLILKNCINGTHRSKSRSIHPQWRQVKGKNKIKI